MKRINLPNQRELVLEYDEVNQSEFGPCPDCGERTKRVWGYVYRLDAAIATYFVEWTPAHPQRDAVFDLIIGTWGDGSTPNDRQAVSVAFKVLDSGACLHGSRCVCPPNWVECSSFDSVGQECSHWNPSIEQCV